MLQLCDNIKDLSADGDSFAKALTCMIAKQLNEYIAETEIPILSEFCSKYGYFEDLITAAASDDTIKIMLKLLEAKKRGRLERMIYTGELNATIGAHLIKSWKEFEPPKEEEPEMPELWILTLTPEEAQQYVELEHKIHGLSR